MKYFELKMDDVNFTEAPRLINWYGIQDVRLITWESYHKLQKRLIYNIDATENVIFTDIISTPFLLVSPMVRDTIRIYEDIVVFKEIILLNVEKKFEEIYYLPIMQESDHIKLLYEKRDIQQFKVPEWIGERAIFWVKQNAKRHTIINLDLAESLLRRNAVGLDLKEVFLCENEPTKIEKNKTINERRFAFGTFN